MEQQSHQNGQNVFLWKNKDGTYEYISETGATGGSSGGGVGANASTDDDFLSSGGGSGGAMRPGHGGGSNAGKTRN